MNTYPRNPAYTKTAWRVLAQAFEEQKPLVGRYLTRIPGGFTVSIAGVVCFLPYSRSSMRLRQRKQPVGHLPSSNPKSGFFPGEKAFVPSKSSLSTKKEDSSSLTSVWSVSPDQVHQLVRKRSFRSQGVLTQTWTSPSLTPKEEKEGKEARVQKLPLPFSSRGFMGQVGLFTLQKLSGTQIVVVEEFSFDPSFY
jgi:hypothetical protein